jgi:hypothetical protein
MDEKMEEILKQIGQIIHYKFDKEKYRFITKNTNSMHIAELVTITSELAKNNIRFILDEQDIIIERNKL